MPLLKSNLDKYCFIVFVFFAIVILQSCSSDVDSFNPRIGEQLDNIEAIMLQKPDTIELLLEQVDTTELTVHEKARISTIRGLMQSNNGDFHKSIKDLGDAEIVFENLKDEYHLHLNKLVKAFTFELLRLDSNSANLYVECENYFQNLKLRKFQFYAALGVVRMKKYLKIERDEKIDYIEQEFSELIDIPLFKGLLYATLAYTEGNDSLCLSHYEAAKYELKKANYRSRLFEIELNLLFKKIGINKTGNIQEYYDNLLKCIKDYSPTVKQELQYDYAQAYIYFTQKKNRQAIKKAREVLDDAAEFNVSNVVMDCTLLLSTLYKRIGDFESAYAMLRRHNQLSEEKLSDLQKIQLIALGAHYKYAELDRERLGLKVQIQRIFIIAIIVISLSVLVFFVTLSRLKINKQQKEILKLENLEIKDQLDKLLGSLEKAENRNDDLIGQVKDMKVQYKESQDVTELLKALESSRIKTWMEYEAIFVKLKPDWIEKLKNEFPQLSPTDLKYCMCLYFNMNNYMISNLCDVGIDAVKSAKKRIRDKLSLNDASEIYFILKEIN